MDLKKIIRFEYLFDKSLNLVLLNDYLNLLEEILTLRRISVF